MLQRNRILVTLVISSVKFSKLKKKKKAGTKNSQNNHQYYNNDYYRT